MVVVLCFEIFHCLYEYFDALFGKGVVERCAESAYRTVAFDAYDAAGVGEGDEFGFELFVLGFHDEAYVHDRTVFNGCRTHEHAAVVDGVVEDGCFLEVELLHCFYAAHLFVIAQCLECREDG